MAEDCNELIALLVKSIKTAKKNNQITSNNKLEEVGGK